MKTTSKNKTANGIPPQKSTATQGFSDIFKTGDNEAGPPKLTEDMILLTYKAAADILGTCQKTVENICRVRREIPIVFVGYMPRIRMSDLRAYIAGGGSTPSQEPDGITDDRPNNSSIKPHDAAHGTKK